MRKVLLIVLMLGICTAYAQNAKLRNGLPQAGKAENQMIAIEPLSQSPIPTNTTKPGEWKNTGKGIVTVIPIGTAANAYSYGYGG